MSMINAPFSQQQIESLKLWQASKRVHPFTCCGGYVLEPIESGMICPRCGAVQTWVQDFMTDRGVVDMLNNPKPPMTNTYEHLQAPHL